MFEDRMRLGDYREGFRREKRRSGRQFDKHVDGIGARKLGVEQMACRDGLLLIGDLIGEPVSRLKMGIYKGKPGDHEEARETVKTRTANHAGGDKTAKPA